MVLSLAGCQPTGSVAPAAGLPGLSLVPSANGLMVAGSGGREIGFGRDQAGALSSVTRVEGRPPQTTDCQSGRQAFTTANGLRLVFEKGTFVGWTDDTGGAGRGCA